MVSDLMPVIPTQHVIFFFFLFVMLFHQGDSISQGLFFSCALSHKHNMSHFNSWVAGARVRFLPKETQQQPGNLSAYIA